MLKRSREISEAENFRKISFSVSVGPEYFVILSINFIKGIIKKFFERIYTPGFDGNENSTEWI